MKKKIWLINQYAMPPQYEMRIQTLKRAYYLQQLGHDVTIISGSYLHNTDINLISENKKFIKVNYEGINFVHFKTPSYKGNGIKRIWSSIWFPLSIILFSNPLDKPDVIAQIATVPFGNLLFFYAKKIKAKYIVDVVDLWPESFVAFGLMSKNNVLVKLAYRAERWLYKKADAVIFSMEGGRDYIIEKKWNKENKGPIDLNKVHYINNGVDLTDFNFNKTNYLIKDSDLEDTSNFKVIYLGSIRLVNNVMQLILAAELLKDHPSIKFLIYGDGDERPKLEQYCKEHKLSNIIFKEKFVELKYVPYILSNSSLNLLNYKPSSIFRFGGSQSKSFQYMASGRPICSNVKMAYCPISKYNLGVSADFNSPQEYAEAILQIANLPKNEYQNICENNKKAAELYDYKRLTGIFNKIIQQLFK